MRRQGAGAVARMDAGLLDVLHDADDGRVLAGGVAVDIHLAGVGEIAIDQQRALVRYHELGGPFEVSGMPRDVTTKLPPIEYTLHVTPAAPAPGPYSDPT